MKPVELPMTFGQKLAEVFVQILWLPISAAINFITLSLPRFPIIMPYIPAKPASVHDTYFVFFIVCILFCWAPFCIVKYILMPKLKYFHAKNGDLDYNVGPSDSIKEEKVQTPVRNSHGQTVAYVEETKYKIEHDSGDRHEWGGASWGLLFYCIFALPLRCISLLLSIFALFIPTLFVCIRRAPTVRPDFWHIALDSHCGNAFIYAKFSSARVTEYPYVMNIATICKFTTVELDHNITIWKNAYDKRTEISDRVLFPKGIFTGNTLLDKFFTCENTYFIESEAFANCTSLRSVTISPCRNCIVQENAFLNCTALQKLYIQINRIFPLDAKGCIIIPSAFNGCHALKEVHLPYDNSYHHSDWYIWKIYDAQDSQFKKGLFVPFEILDNAEKTAILMTKIYRDCVWRFESCDANSTKDMKTIPKNFN